MRVVLSDTSPLRYLIAIGAVDLLRQLYGRIIIPASVAAELDQPRTPQVVRQWISQPPDWIEILQPDSGNALITADLDAGERDAISLALDLKADLILLDDRGGVAEALRLGLTVIGTLGVLDRAASMGFIDLPAAIAALRTTNFRASPALLERLLAKNSQRHE